MFEASIRTLAGEFRGARCLRDVAQYWQFRCTVPGPALGAASDFVRQRHQENGVEARVIPYPADDRTEWLGRSRLPLAWFPRSARLSAVGPDGDAERICDYADEPLCLASNSTGTPIGGVTAPLVVVPGADREEGYAGLNVEGRIILVDRPAMNVDALARQRGVVGVISDCVAPAWLAQYPPVRVAADAPDLTMWSILSGRRAAAGLWGFNLTPRQGAYLRRLLAANGGDLRVHAVVDARLAEGTAEVVEAVLPGTDRADEEIWVLAHSSEPGARDNASGCCVGIELARVLAHLTATGRLAPLRRTVRLLNGVEVDGFLPYLHQRQADLGRVVAGLCLDGLGMDSALAGGSLLAFRAPETDASFVDGLVRHLCATVAAMPAEVFGGDPYELFAWDTAPYWGNDAFLARGFFDVPTPQLSCWPDRYYHSAQDTTAQMSVGALTRAATIAGVYLHVLATAGPTEAGEIARLAAYDWKHRIIDALTQPETRRSAGAVVPLARHLGYQATDAIAQVRRLAPEDPGLRERTTQLAADLRGFAQREGEAAAGWWSASGDPAVPPALDPVSADAWPVTAVACPGDAPVDGRVFRRRVWHRPDEAGLSPAGRDRLAALRAESGKVDRAWHWLNGRRTVVEVWERLQAGGTVSAAVLQAYLEALEAEGLVGQGPR